MAEVTAATEAQMYQGILARCERAESTEVAIKN
jgi:hypothetical protein